ncbi:CDP-glycerol glycerophosphotransferase family protein [Gracilibacillus alcaliphilus]|uniref:CDP-glycerol glycerophosphotransferase family protein n=1 Tax=Gracilibacillus alcaliphilus TaxID=1401441 RepID=UPI001EF99FC1|nr:CDP-glycerol glycerophosphotransferase family protein [Gracilibacillus alcaliphilus]MBM7678412.1 CDP-glycerol glycerophosphotransferase (TagB/SpsB family) [Gracilibacillus alcaliphilus]
MQAKKITFVLSFHDTGESIWNHLDSGYQKIIIKEGKKKNYPKEDGSFQVLPLHSKNPFLFIRSLYHLATSKLIIIDNYFGFLSVTNFKPEVQVIQLWHAAGAIKQFGLQDRSITHRSKAAHQRFQQVYDHFDKIVVGSDKMVEIFQESFGLDESHFLKTGIPRTDFFFQEQEMEKCRHKLEQKYPVIKERRVILYAPTFRDKQLDHPEIHLDFQKLFDAFRKEYVILLKLHPAVAAHAYVHLPSFVVDVSAYPYVNHLLTISDILITDYSSIPFEFSLLDKPMIFFPYDLEEYQQERGFWEPYEENMPGPIAFDTEQLIEIIRNHEFDMERVRQFARKWNQYSDGSSSKKLIQALHLKTQDCSDKEDGTTDEI